MDTGERRGGWGWGWGREGRGGEGRGGEQRNVLDIMKWYLLSACTKRNPHVVVLKRNRGEGKMNVAQLRPFYFGIPKATKGFKVWCFWAIFLWFSFSTNSTFFFFWFPQCCNVGSHGSNFDVLKVLSLHTFVSSFHSLSQCPSNNKVVVTKLCLKSEEKKPQQKTKKVSTNVKSSCREAVVLDMYL